MATRLCRRVLYAYADSTGQSISPIALQRLYAIRESGAPFNFRLSGTLPRLTREWQQRTEGRVTFWYAPGQHPNPKKISHASSFVDSVSKLFQVPPPQHLDVYVGRSLEDVQRATGLDFFPAASVDRGLGGRAIGGRILLVGNPALGEAYLQELTHAILGPTFPIRNGLFNEGVATWLGGSRGHTPQQMYARLLKIQTARPALTLAQVLTNDIPGASAEELTDAFTATGALLVDAVYRRSGIAGSSPRTVNKTRGSIPADPAKRESMVRIQARLTMVGCSTHGWQASRREWVPLIRFSPCASRRSFQDGCDPHQSARLPSRRPQGRCFLFACAGRSGRLRCH